MSLRYDELHHEFVIVTGDFISSACPTEEDKRPAKVKRERRNKLSKREPLHYVI